MILLIGGKMPYYMFYFVVLLPLLSFGLLLISFLFLKIEQHIDHKINLKSDTINQTFKIKNSIFLIPYVNIIFYNQTSIKNDNFENLQISLFPFQKNKFEKKIKCYYRGKLKLGIKKLEIIDFLGLIKLSTKNYPPIIVTVYPKIKDINNFNVNWLDSTKEYMKNNDFTNNSSEISEINKYEFGDSLNKIHWKISAKKNDLMIKKFYNFKSNTNSIFLDLSKLEYSNEKNIIIEDRIIELLISLLNYFLKNNIDTNLIFHKENIINMECKNSKDFYQIYDKLAEIEFNFSGNFLETFNLIYSKLLNLNYNQLIIFVYNISKNIVENLQEKNSNTHIYILNICPKDSNIKNISNKNFSLNNIFL
jgi:uncharacterized protein (DUF58 family)